MTIAIKDGFNLQQYNKVTVYLKSADVPEIVIPGKVVSVEAHSVSVWIKTESNFAVFSQEDVIAVTFG